MPVKGQKLARSAGKLTVVQKLMAGVVGLVAPVLLWKAVLQPLIILAIVIGIAAILLLTLSKLFGKDGPEDEDDKDD